ncbi:hypothetical protein [Flavobacterium lacisediminis]|uniref:SdpI family protein n=1 Tax=Flavobacterium lacisediminis TaxID=2989705 RepID=A0ABT3EF00_9FLAO|nr:hypothetical protein [Flavobacterium lacisediminis]MCW1147154.1 hypothetical protein [Flavobacterium lacisediminis]
MKVFFKINSILLIVISIIIAFGLFLEINTISKNSVEYIHVYSISENATEWKYQSIENFKKWNLLLGILVLAYAALNGFALLTKNHIVKKLVFAINIFMVIFLLFNFFEWATSGFDH